jgi:hypothetical protein
MTVSHVADERRLLDAWVTGRGFAPEDEDPLRARGFDQDYGKTYTRLNAWVGAFAVKDIQERLPNCAIRGSDGRFVLTCRADSPEAMGYCDFALGSVGPDEDWREAARQILVNNWRDQFEGWGQWPWVQLWGTGLVTAEEAFAWRAEAWRGHESIVEGTIVDDASAASDEQETSA